MITVVVAAGKLETSQRWVDAFKQRHPDWQVHCWELVKDTVQADFAVVWRPEAQLFVDQPQLKAVFNVAAGVDGIDFTQVPDSIPVYRVEDAGMAVQMAEYAVQGVLLATQRFTPYVESQKNKIWQRTEPVLREQWPIGVMGYGQIGKKVVQVLQSLGYPVSTWVRSERVAPEGVQLFVGAEQLDAFLSHSRILINVLPLTAETRGLINAKNLAEMPAGGFFINMARGPHVIDEDLIAAIDTGHLTGALLDVFHIEPLPTEHPYWSHPKIHITPHISGMTLRDQTAGQISRKIQEFLQGQSVSGLVERKRQY